MRAKASGPVGAFLMIAPLVAIPIVAIVGIPQFAPVVASSADDGDDFGGEPVSEPDDPRSPPADHFGGPVKRGAEDLFAPLHDSSPPGSEMQNQRTQWTPPAGALDGWEVAHEPPRQAERAPLRRPIPFDATAESEPLRPAQAQAMTETAAPTATVAGNFDTSVPQVAPNAQRFNEGLIHPVVVDGNDSLTIAKPQAPGAAKPQAANLDQSELREPYGAPFTWQEATQRLKELGIRKYHFEALEGSDRFLFTCSLTPSHDPRITHRFEAESDEPLSAVQRVLEQIDAWQTQR